MLECEVQIGQIFFFFKSNLGFLMWQSVYSIPKQIKQCVKDTCGLYRPPDLRTCYVHSGTRESQSQEALP